MYGILFVESLKEAIEKAAKGKISSDLSSAEDSFQTNMALRKKKKITNDFSFEPKTQSQPAKKKCPSPPIFEDSSGYNYFTLIYWKHF